MTTASVSQIESQFGAFVEASQTAPVVVTRNRKPVAVIVGVQDKDDFERLLMACSPRLQAILEKSRRQIREGHALTHDDFWAKVETSRTAQRRGDAKKAKRNSRSR